MSSVHEKIVTQRFLEQVGDNMKMFCIKIRHGTEVEVMSGSGDSVPHIGDRGSVIGDGEMDETTGITCAMVRFQGGIICSISPLHLVIVTPDDSSDDDEDMNTTLLQRAKEMNDAKRLASRTKQEVQNKRFKCTDSNFKNDGTVETSVSSETQPAAAVSTLAVTKPEHDITEEKCTGNEAATEFMNQFCKAVSETRLARLIKLMAMANDMNATIPERARAKKLIQDRYTEDEISDADARKDELHYNSDHVVSNTDQAFTQAHGMPIQWNVSGTTNVPLWFSRLFHVSKWYAEKLLSEMGMNIDSLLHYTKRNEENEDKKKFKVIHVTTVESVVCLITLLHNFIYTDLQRHFHVSHWTKPKGQFNSFALGYVTGFRAEMIKLVDSPMFHEVVSDLSMVLSPQNKKDIEHQCSVVFDEFFKRSRLTKSRRSSAAMNKTTLKMGTDAGTKAAQKFQKSNC